MDEEDIKEVIVDTYALLAMVYDEVSDKSREILVKIRYGGIRGLIPATVAYEFTVHWLEGRIPRLRDIDEVVTFLKIYFQVISSP